MKFLITSGPTREYLDPVRFVSNGSSGRMGAALAEAVFKRGHQAIIVSGPVVAVYPKEAEVHWVETTDEMLRKSEELFPDCDMLIGAAAPSDFRPIVASSQKIPKGRLTLELTETPDILATLGAKKAPHQRILAFALETTDGRNHALQKLRKKNADWIALNSPDTINSDTVSLELIAAYGQTIRMLQGEKNRVAELLIDDLLGLQHNCSEGTPSL